MGREVQMTKKHIVIIVGTRPEAIKMAPVYLAMKANHHIKTTFLATAQHRQMLDQVLSVFGIDVDVDLDVMQSNQILAQTSARIIVGVQNTLEKLKPDAVLVHGDTATCLCSAIAAFYQRIPVGHVEAGLRTYNFKAPWPEEMNRRLVDPISQWCFAPTSRAADNLRSEHIAQENIFITGNTVIDALFIVKDIISRQKPKIKELADKCLDGYRLILVTGHRRESFGKPFRNFCQALREIISKYHDTVVVYPVHLNPNVQKTVNNILGKQDRIYLIPPVEYLQFTYLMEQSYMIISDSGGVQEEAPSLHKPVLVTREVTERPEVVEAGLAKLVGTSTDIIIREASRLLDDAEHYSSMSHGENPYGKGDASEQIIDVLLSTL